MTIKELEPKALWSNFYSLTRCPRPSKHEEAVRNFLVKWAKDKKIECRVDKVGNVIMTKPATKGMENRRPVVLQAHMDMVPQARAGKVHDFLKDPIETKIVEDWVYACDTTLGADDGMGVAAIMAVFESKTIKHGPLEALITTDEETGMTGAFGLKAGELKGEFLLNLDSETEGELYVGCAGGIDTTVAIDYTTRYCPAGEVAYRVKVSGLKGGHSGDDINKGLGNANKMLTRILWNATDKCKIGLARIDGGNLRNAIAREAWADIVVAKEFDAQFRQMVDTFRDNLTFEFRSTEPDLKVELNPIEMPQLLIDRDTQYKLLNALFACAHGVLAMSREIPNFVETSTNLASVKMDDRQIHIATSQRSSVESAKHAAAQKIEATFRMIGAHVSHGDGYPGWTPNPASRVLKVGVDTYKSMYGHEPIVRAIHAGLECGLIGEKYPKMDMISYGPTLRGVHSPDERIEIKTVQMFWDLTLQILKNLK